MFGWFRTSELAFELEVDLLDIGRGFWIGARGTPYRLIELLIMASEG